MEERTPDSAQSYSTPVLQPVSSLDWLLSRLFATNAGRRLGTQLGVWSYRSEFEVEPAIAISALAKLIQLGMKGWNASNSPEFDEKDVAAIQGMLETTASLAQLRTPATRLAAAQHVALIVRSFGQAVGKHQEFHGRLLLTGALRRFLNRSDRERAEEIELRVKMAALHVRELGLDLRSDLYFVDSLSGSPLNTPFYRRLWQSFSDPQMTLPGETPPLVMNHTTRREFERYFLLSYLNSLESPAGRIVSAHLGNLRQYRTAIIRDLLIQDIATWGGRHVFGNVSRDKWGADEPMPFLPLENLYVESDGALENELGVEGRVEPLAGLIERLTSANEPAQVVVVVADFGSGKSVSARMLAKRWADTALGSQHVSLDSVVPIYIRCAEDFSHDTVDLPATVRAAWKRQAASFGLPLSDDDDAFAWPIDKQRVVCMLDGLDEITLGEQQLRVLFKKLLLKTTETHRFVVFSRPGALPARADLGERVSMVLVRPFEQYHVIKWLSGWNEYKPPRDPAVTWEMIVNRGFEAIVKTPILLLMVVFTWKDSTIEGRHLSLAEIYESFFVQIASGKAAVDRERHGAIASASEALLAELIERRFVEVNCSVAHAMMWLMGRVAWEARVLEARSPAELLTRRHVDNLLYDELRVPVDAVHSIQIALILTMQADLRNANHVLLFGHQSFREFLVGRYWATTLRQIARAHPREWDTLGARLHGGRLLGHSSKDLSFLVQLINASGDASEPRPPTDWTNDDRKVIVRWAQDAFADESQAFGGNHVATHRLDKRPMLREAALAIGSLIKDSIGLRSVDELTLRSLLSWFWLHQSTPVIVAPRSTFQKARLDDVDLSDAQLDEADLAQSSLTGADLSRTILTRARLGKANMWGTTMVNANLDGADLSGSNLTGANLTSASLVGACADHARFDGARLSGSRLNGASLRHASFVRANLEDCALQAADMQCAILSGARLGHSGLEGAKLRDADFSSAELIGARLMGAVMDRSRLVNANLQGADLSGANLAEADLSGAVLQDVRYNSSTRWPEHFDPVSRGAWSGSLASDMDEDS